MREDNKNPVRMSATRDKQGANPREATQARQTSGCAGRVVRGVARSTIGRPGTERVVNVHAKDSRWEWHSQRSWQRTCVHWSATLSGFVLDVAQFSVFMCCVAEGSAWSLLRPEHESIRDFYCV